MASLAKKRKLQVLNNQRQNSLPARIFHDICVYIVPIKLPNQRVQFLKQLALKKGFPTSDSFRYQKWTIQTFVVVSLIVKTAYDASCEQLFLAMLQTQLISCYCRISSFTFLQYMFKRVYTV